MPLRIFQKHRRLGLGVLILLFIIVVGAALRIWRPDAPDVVTPVTVQEPLRLTRTVLLHPAHTQTVTSLVSGRVDGAVPTPGGFVREGDVLVTVLALTAPPAAAPAPPVATRDTTQADAWLVAGIITRAEHDRLVGTPTVPAARTATPAAPVAHPLTAPMTGRIGQVYVETDGPLIAGMPALTVQATDTLTAALVIPPALAPLLRDPLAVRMRVTLDSHGTHHGELAAVDTSDPAAVIAKLRFANPDDTLPVETEVPVTLTGTATMTVTRLPLSARRGDHSLTVVDAAGIIDRRAVVTAYTTAADWVILDGLRPGDRVITNPSDRWQVGMKVEV